MRNFDETNITTAALARISNAEDARTRAISQALVRHLHAFIREVEPTFEEWEAGVEFLTRVGHFCDDKRQEFVLLSDALGVSMLVDAINHRAEGGVTESTVLGPYHVKGAPDVPIGANISPGATGELLLVTGTVKSARGEPIADALIDVWHSDEHGLYDVQRPELANRSTMRARLRSDSHGAFRFWTIRPAPYRIPHDGPVGEMLEAQGRHPWRPAHVHFMIEKPHYRKLVTHVFIDGDPYLESDVVFGVKDSLIAELQPRRGDRDDEQPGEARPGGHWHLEYDFVLASA
ncbi:intradiol ring-cleavage dioxygenase [Pendulispora albinea]|uniref:Intradiol ring-cleavage dioxygenase n=1 Tax=Pendulispora albinea TaxID=2741071 RepID=A0ABZ2LZE3_9BACT